MEVGARWSTIGIFSAQQNSKRQDGHGPRKSSMKLGSGDEIAFDQIIAPAIFKPTYLATKYASPPPEETKTKHGNVALCESVPITPRNLFKSIISKSKKIYHSRIRPKINNTVQKEKKRKKKKQKSTKHKQQKQKQKSEPKKWNNATPPPLYPSLPPPHAHPLLPATHPLSNHPPQSTPPNPS